MTDQDPLDDRLRDGFRRAADSLQPEPVADPAALADHLMTRSVPPARGLLGGWRGVAAVGALAVAGIGVGSWIGTAASDAGPEAGRTVEAATVGAVQLWRCPGVASVGRLVPGDRVVLTGRSTDGAWLELRHPVDLSARAWVSADVVDADSAPGALPVVECGTSAPGTAAPSDADNSTTSTVPSTSSTSSTATSTPSTTQPVPGTTTTLRVDPVPPPSTTKPAPPPADTTGPTLANVGASPSTIWTVEQPGVPCPPDKRKWTTSVSASVSDAGGVSAVRLNWSVNGRSGTVDMARVGGTWRGTVGPFAANTLPTSGAGMNQAVSVTIRATDSAGNVSTASTGFQLRSSAECFG